MLAPNLGKISLPSLALIGSTFCSRAPSIEFLGTFFPVWMLCILSALAITGLIRAVLVRWHLEQKVGPQVVFYPGLLLAFSCLLWLVFYS